LDPDDTGALSTAQAIALIDSAAELGKPIFVFSGGEPLLREDWKELAQHARSLGLPTALATNGTLVDEAMARRMAACRFHRVSVSIDGDSAASHDNLRGSRGAFDAAMRGIAELRKAGVPFQVNSTITTDNVGQLDRLYELARSAGAVALHLFVLVPVGCGLQLAETHQLSPQEYEAVLEWVCRQQVAGPLEMKATCAPQFHRVAQQYLRRHAGDVGRAGLPAGSGEVAWAGLPTLPGAERLRAILRGRGCLGGRAVIFVSHAGEIFPCGYFPRSCGNVLKEGLVAAWRNSPLLAELRDDARLGGKCGACEYHSVCGGCRARALAVTGDYLAEDASCAYSPRSSSCPAGSYVNDRCPIMTSSKIDPAKTTPNLVREYKGMKVAFCCSACVDMWDKLTDAEKDAKLAAVMRPGATMPAK
jgi:radical SAM protein with 4Fe4S-binding SPASM domain